MLKVILCLGIQASGKTTYAKQYCKDNPNTIRLNRDNIREMLSQKWSSNLEEMVKNIEHRALLSALCLGFNVIIDDVSNLSVKTRYTIEMLINQANIPGGIEIETVEFFIPVSECIKRDAEREHPIGEKIIRDTYNKYKLIIEK